MTEPDISFGVHAESHVGVVEMQRPPNNFLDIFFLRSILDAMESLDANPECRCIILRAQGKHFCAGRDFNAPRREGDSSEEIYRTARRLLQLGTPWVAEVQGAASGSGMGLAVAADFRTCGDQAYFSANFVKLGLHHGFGLTVTLPNVMGWQAATDLLYSGRRVGAEEALRLQLVDRHFESDELQRQTMLFAESIAKNDTAAVSSIRTTMRAGLLERFIQATEHESTEQSSLRPS